MSERVQLTHTTAGTIEIRGQPQQLCAPAYRRRNFRPHTGRQRVHFHSHDRHRRWKPAIPPRPGDMPPATTPHPPPPPSPPTGVIRRRLELDTMQRVGFRRLLTSTAITINQHNPKSGASYERYDGYRFATVIGDFLAKSPSNSKGWMDLLNDGRRGLITIDDNAFINLLPKPVCSALSCMTEI